MAGISFSCGTFEGREKTGSAIAGVLEGLVSAPPNFIASIREVADKGRGVITENQARIVLPLLVEYRAHLVQDIGHDDWMRENEAEVKAGLDPVRANGERDAAGVFFAQRISFKRVRRRSPNNNLSPFCSGDSSQLIRLRS